MIHINCYPEFKEDLKRKTKTTPGINIEEICYLC